MGLTFYMFELSPPSRAVWMCLKEMGVDFELKSVNLLQGEHKQEEFTKINPFQAVPVIDDNGFKLGESRAILPYIAAKYGKGGDLYPKDPKKRAIIDQLLCYDIGTTYKACLTWGFPQILQGVPPTEEATKNLKDALQQFNDEHLGKKTYLAGDKLTIADFSSLASITYLELFQYDFGPYPNIKAWVNRLKQKPYYSECNDKMFEIVEMIKQMKAGGQ